MSAPTVAAVATMTTTIPFHFACTHVSLDSTEERLVLYLFGPVVLHSLMAAGNAAVRSRNTRKNKWHGTHYRRPPCKCYSCSCYHHHRSPAGVATRRTSSCIVQGSVIWDDGWRGGGGMTTTTVLARWVGLGIAAKAQR